MPPRLPHRLPSEPSPTVKEALRKRLSRQDLPAFGVVIALRMAAQQMENAITEWMSDNAGSPARFQILSLLWASESGGVPHKEIVQALQVTRATVSGLMAALERDGLVKSVTARDDRRNLIANLTSRGRTMFEQAIDRNVASLRAAFATLSGDELATLDALLQRLRDGFIAARDRPGNRRIAKA